MAYKYPFLRSSVTPFGLMEQLGVAFTSDPAEDGAATGSGSWFGRLLSDASFVFDFVNSTSPRETFNKTQLVNKYFTRHFKYTAYDWECLNLRITRAAGGAESGIIEGEVDIKVEVCNECRGGNAHNGTFDFSYEIARPNATSSWKVTKWSLTRKAAISPDPKVPFI